MKKNRGLWDVKFDDKNEKIQVPERLYCVLMCNLNNFHANFIQRLQKWS